MPMNGSRRAAYVFAFSGAMLLACSVGGCHGGSRATTRSAQSFGDQSELPAPVRTSDTYEAFGLLGYRPEWVGYAVMPSGRRVTLVSIFDDIVTVHNTGNLLSALETRTGAIRWSAQMASSQERFVGTGRTASGDVLSCSQGEVFVLDSKTGIPKDRHRLVSLANTPPVVVDAMVLFGCNNGEVLALNLNSGYKQWGHVLTGAIRADLVRVRDYVAAVSDGGDVVVLEPTRGELRGRAKIFGGSDAPIAASEEALFISSLDQSLWSFGLDGAPAAWRMRTEFPLRDKPVYHEGHVYAAVPGQGLVCVNAATGEKKWTLEGQGGHVVGVRGDKLVVWDGATAVTVDPERGDADNRVTLEGTRDLLTDAFVDGNLYAITPRGQVSKFSPRK